MSNDTQLNINDFEGNLSQIDDDGLRKNLGELAQKKFASATSIDKLIITREFAKLSESIITAHTEPELSTESLCDEDFLEDFEVFYPEKLFSLEGEIEDAVETDKSTYSPMLKEFVNAKKFTLLKHYLQKTTMNEPELFTEIYEKCYLNNANLEPEQIERCKKINNEFNTKVFLSELNNQNETLDVIEQELNEWKQKSGGKAILPRIVDCTFAHQSIFDASGSVTGSNPNLIWLNPGERDLPSIIRHEMVHLNEAYSPFKDIYPPPKIEDYSDVLPSKCDERGLLRELSMMRGKKITSLEGEDENQLKAECPEYFSTVFDKCKYREELLRGGLQPFTVGYACTSREEFIAEAASGITENYSDEFKGRLVKMGLPDYVFDMKNFSNEIQSRVETLEMLITLYRMTAIKNPAEFKKTFPNNLKSYDEMILLLKAEAKLKDMLKRS